jgi:hypothetical protein
MREIPDILNGVMQVRVTVVVLEEDIKNRKKQGEHMACRWARLG